MAESIQNFITLYGLVAIFLLMFANGLISGPPSELVLVFAGISASSTINSFLIVCCTAILGNLVGTLFLYGIGRLVGENRVNRLAFWVKKKIKCRVITKSIPSRNNISAMTLLIKKEGKIWVGVLRCLPAVRSIISLPAGIAQMPIISFTIISFVGIAAWAAFWISVGFMLTETWYSVNLPTYTCLTILLLSVIFILYRRLKIYADDMVKQPKNR